ncbi:gliding motility-associated C-terminal domain-containing protein [Flaviramulus basaltis]|uniref:Gliding motility-associated C-terminal domain-containing protein n=1 Tax=Flaviramulus basaltis TaxID=369401 RepID=A0A1K2ING1_9FLAO|nr:T9SS type B sorting domain-containing protein [Flaviramulus basaltis]SFZ93980.1 gliding motility-associated C-terminal domain-containing protein [Flaviramulus basaltis]
MRFIYYILFILVCSSNSVFSQQISVDDTVGLQPLIENNLVNGCGDISNISSSINGSSSGFPSYAYFERASSNFPFEKGIMLSTGSAGSGGNALRTPTLSEGSTAWGTDPDLETALGITNTVNATSIEFDFISISNQFQFNYLLASEEYFGINPCQFSDGFVFLIKEAGTTNPYQNIALVPGTSTPVNTNTIHDEIFGVCAAQNDQYFDGYNVGDTNYNGRTTVLSASGSIVPNVTYHIKLIIADQTDGTFDSAVFIEGDSFKNLDLGEDIATCAAFATLNADIENPIASYAWYLDGTLITGAINPTLNAVLSGTYRVEVSVPVNGINCVEQDEIIVVLNTEEPINSITDYELCDDTSSDAVETFDLSTKNTELENNIPFTNYDYSYHLSDADARNNLNPITTPITNTVNPQTIYVRIDDDDSNCFSYTTFNLIVNPVPNIVTPTSLNVCDGDDTPDGFAIIDLTQKDSEIIAGNNNLMVSYHYNSFDVSTGDNPIPSPYINTNTPSDLIYVRVVDTTTGCVNTTTLNVNTTVSPVVNRDTQYIDACDRDLDGNASFDLTEVINEILSGLTGVSTTFHVSYTDAETGDNVIANETNYQYTNAVIEPGSSILYLRIVDDSTGCFSIIPFEIHTNLLLTGTDTGDFALCDDNEDITDSLAFNLNTVELFIANDLPNPINVTFFEDEDDRNNNVNALDKSQLYIATSPQTLYIRIEDGECLENTEITLLVNPILLFSPIDPIPYCDDDDDGITSIDLASIDEIVTSGNTNFTVTYFLDQTDAEINNTNNQLPPFYTNTNSIETLYARVESVNSGCATVNPFQIEIFVAPTTTQPTDIIICDDNQDGFYTVNLNNKILEIVSSTTGVDIDFFTSFEDADADTNIIPVSQRDAYNTNTQTIYVRVEDNISNTNCYSIVSFEAIINTLPVFPTIADFQVCEDDGDTFADFLLVDKDAEILNGQTGKEVFYFEDSAYTIPIDKNNLFQNTTSPQTIYVRVENITDPTCFGNDSFILLVSPDPVYNPVIDYLVCDDDSNDGKNVFDLSEKITEISQGSLDMLNISFHLTRNEAGNNTNPLPLSYTNATNPQSLYIRIESDDSLCYVVEELGINIIASPDVTQVSEPLINCDADYDGITTFDLTTADFQILDRVQSNLIVNYFENIADINENDGLDNTNEIPDPTNFNSNSKTIYIKIANTLTGCYTVLDLELIVNLPPPINNVGTIDICDNDTNTFDLSLVNSIIIDDVSLVNITYHSTYNDAENNVAPLNNTYNYTSNNHVIYIRIFHISTGCYITSSFNLQINKNPTPNTPPDLIDCDDDFDGFLDFDLSMQNNPVLGLLSPTNFTVTYYNDINNANTATNPLPTVYSAFNGDIIFARLENNNTGCYGISQFTTYVNALPIIPIDDIVPLCNNDLPLIIDAYTGNPNDTYLWSTGESTVQIQLDDPSQIGDYWVTATTPNPTSNDCSNTKSFSVIESEEANINFTTTVDFADPNSITVDINGIGDYVFIIDDGEPQTSNVFENVTFGIHMITIRDLNGCKDVTTDVVVIDAPKFFTPNSDSYSDTWHIIGINQLPGTVVFIYNRYGKLLKTLPYTSIGWDGTFNGQNMPSDDYWFIAKVIQDGNSFDLKGHFALKR